MKLSSIIIIVLALFTSISTHTSSNLQGAFGIEFGENVSLYKQDFQKCLLGKSCMVLSPPKPYRAFSSYHVQTNSNNNISTISALSNPIYSFMVCTNDAKKIINIISNKYSFDFKKTNDEKGYFSSWTTKKTINDVGITINCLVTESRVPDAKAYILSIEYTKESMLKHSGDSLGL